MADRIIWTIGHSTRSLAEFMDILEDFHIQCLADIRSLPGSRKFPHFNKENLEASLPPSHIQYIHMSELGGRRKTRKDSRNTGWRLDAFRGYADYMETAAFEKAVENLEKTALQMRTAYMCAEGLWWRCHRSLVSDYLKLHGWTVMHIMHTGKATEHPYTSVAKIEDGKLVYRQHS